MKKICVLLVVCFVVLPLFAQENQPEDAPASEIELRKISIFGPTMDRDLRIATESDLTGTNGTLWLDSGTDVILRANNVLRLQTAATDRFWLFNNGHASFGANSDQGRLSLFEYGDGTRSLMAYHHATIEATATQTDYAAFVQAQQAIAAGVTNSGTLVGTHSQAYNFGPGTVTNIHGAAIYAGNVGTADPATISTNVTGLLVQVTKGPGSIASGWGLKIGDIQATSDWGIYQAATNDSNYFAGNVIIGGVSTVTIPANNVLYVKGESYFDGTVTGTNIKAHYQDVAEWVPATTDLAPGTVVTLNRARNNEVMASATAYDTSVAGVVSEQPGITLGIEGEGMEQIATTGRVKVRVDARQNPVGVGDLLVTSDIPGTAMRSEPMNINGRKFHQPGTIIGKALEPLESGIGEILVLLSMQ
jgi:hypothetical protein